MLLYIVYCILDQRNRATCQYLQDPNEINGDNLNNVRREARIYFRKISGNIGETKLISLKGTGRTRASDNCLEEYITEEGLPT
jgi:hypothetical protein